MKKLLFNKTVREKHSEGKNTLAIKFVGYTLIKVLFMFCPVEKYPRNKDACRNYFHIQTDLHKQNFFFDRINVNCNVFPLQ